MDLHVASFGSGPETVVFSHGYLMDHRMFDAQIARLKDRYRVVAFDHRGHGRSARCREPFDIYALMEDGVRVIREHCDGPVHWVGMSTGGYVGQRILVRHPELLRSLTLIDTSASAESAAALRSYGQMLTVVRWLGTRPVLGRALQILMGEPFRTDPARAAEFQTWRRRILALDGRSLVRFGEAVFHRDDLVDALERAPRIPFCVMVGALDAATPVDKAEELAAALGVEALVIPKAGHASPVEEADAVSDALEAFLSAL